MTMITREPGHTLVELSSDWTPWKFSVETWNEGTAWGRPKEIICTGTANFKTRHDAEKLLKKLKRR